MNFDDAAQRLVELAASRHNAIHTTEAADQGFHSHRLRRARQRGEMIELRPKVWAHAALPRSRRQTIRAATLCLPASAAGYRSAAWLHGWIDDPPPLPELWVPQASRARLPLASVHRFSRIRPDLDVVEIENIWCLNKAATLCLLGATASPDVVERCLDEFLRTEHRGWLEQTLGRLSTPHAPGPRTLLAVVNDPARVSGVTDSWMERVVSRLVSLPWLPPVELQHELAVDDKRFRVDIAVPELQLGVEAHSRAFHWGPRTENADNVRDLLIGGLGWQLLYVTWAQLRDPDAFVRQFCAVALARAEQLGVPISGCLEDGAQHSDSAA